jgi:hypothetical protein
MGMLFYNIGGSCFIGWGMLFLMEGYAVFDGGICCFIASLGAIGYAVL